MRTQIVLAFAGGMLAAVAATWIYQERQPQVQATQPAREPLAVTIPDVPVLDQDGKPRNFYGDLVRGRTVAIDFIYTSCPSFCLPLTANLRVVQEELGARIGKDIELISISLDPVADTPAKLKAFAAQFGAGPGWSFVTGAMPDVARLADKLGQPLGNPADHSPLVLIYNDRAGSWARVDGGDAKTVRDALLAAAGPAAASRADAAGAALAYMRNPLLLTQDGEPVRFFDDLLRGKTVLINFMLTTCRDTCPMVSANLARVQDLLGDKVGRSIHMISLSVDPGRDRPAELKQFADNFGAKPGWYFLTGEPPEIDPLLRRLAAYTTSPLDHSTILILGNVEAGVWTKVFAMAEPTDIARAVLALQAPSTK